jgi:hypothetical protein
MKSSLFKILVVTVTLAVIVPSVYLIINQYKSSVGTQSPQSFVPANSQFAAKFNALNESNYVFLEEGSFAFVLQMGTFAYSTGFNSSSTLSNSSTGSQTGSLHYYYYGTYNHVPIFKTSLNISGVLSKVIPTASAGSFLNITAGNLNLTKVSLYIAAPASGIFLMGEIDAVHAAIDSNQRLNGNVPLGYAFNTSANISLYANLYSESQEYYMSGNFTSNNTVISIYGESLNTSSPMFAAIRSFGTLFNGTVSLSAHSIVVSYPVGIGSKLFSQLFKYFLSILAGAL